MLAETIWTVACSCMTMVVFVPVIAGMFYLYGFFFLQLLRLPNIGSSFVIAVGMTSVIFFGWYVYKIGIPLTNYIISFFFVAVSLFGIYFRNNLKNSLQTDCFSFVRAHRTIFALLFFALLFTLQALIAFSSTTNPIGSIGNNDIFTWSLMAEQLLGAPGLLNIFPGGSKVANAIKIDSWGTYFILAFISKFVRLSAIEATPYFTVYALTLIGLVFF